MAKFIIRGQHRLSGAYRPVGNKNAVLPMLAAAVLTDEPVTLHNVPDIVDVNVMLELLTALGVAVEQKDHTVTLCAAGLRSRRLDRELCTRVRSSILLAGPMAARHGRVVLYPPGGDVIGRRRLDTHFDGLRALGISVEGGKFFTFRRRELRGADLMLDEASVTATENILMAAVLAAGTTTIFNAACEPHVRDLGLMLNEMGAKIEGLGTNRLTIHGVGKLRGVEHTVGPDHIEIGSFLAAAAATRGDLTVEGLNADVGLTVIQRSFQKMGVSLSFSKGSVALSGKQKLRVQKDLGGAIPKIEDGAWPAFPSDLMSVAIVLATQVNGAMLFFEKMFESRMYFVDRLLEMGARLIQCDPHRVLVTGPSRLHGTHLTTPDIRAGMSLIIAALCAKGESVIDNAQIIDRGYEHVDERLRALGADIVREEA
jgi:UDP-N-acetylglucosamine 1-carboxyvinyltransferase